MLSINTNLSSIIAQNSMKQSTNALNQAIERMSTGFKINHAKDNAANYSISTNMTTKISAYQVAEENCAMGLDMVTTASSTLDLVSEHVQRIRDLCEQASNGTYGEESLKAIQSEIDARQQEVDRIISQAEYNGIKMLEGGASGPTYAQTDVPFLKPITRLTEEQAIAQGYTPVYTQDDLTTAISNNESICLMNDLDLTGLYTSYWQGGSFTPFLNYNHDSYSSIIEGNGYTMKLTTENGYNSDSGYYYLLGSSNATIKNLNLDFISPFSNSKLRLTDPGSVLENCAITGTVIISDTFDIKSTLIDSYINLDSIGTPTTINPINSTNCYYNKEVLGDIGDGGVTEAELNAILAAAQPTGIKGDRTISLQIGTMGDSNSQLSFVSSIALESLAINCLDSDSARSSLTTLDDYLKKINAKQVEYGAVQNRLESALEEISVQYDNLVSSRSTLRDADIAEVSSHYIQQQILQQASATLMATANQSPSIALQLI